MSKRSKRILSVLEIVPGVWFMAAIIGMFFVERYPFLGGFVTWTFIMYAGVFAMGIIGLMVIGPGIYVAKEFYENISYPQASILETRLTQFWCGVAGFLLSALLGTVMYLIIFGPLAEVKMWFISVCYVVIVCPWLLVGFLGRKMVRHYFPLKS